MTRVLPGAGASTGRTRSENISTFGLLDVRPAPWFSLQGGAHLTSQIRLDWNPVTLCLQPICCAGLVTDQVRLIWEMLEKSMLYADFNHQKWKVRVGDTRSAGPTRGFFFGRPWCTLILFMEG